MTMTEGFERVRVLCVGDVMIDRFVRGTVNRISPERPIPVFSITGEDLFPGGAANVARNIVSLGGRCTLVGVTGADGTALALKAVLGESAGITACFIEAPGRPTTEKVRFVSGGQHLLRADRENSGPVSEEVGSQLLAALEELIGSHDILVLSDYAKGLLTDQVVAGAIAIARRADVAIVVDPKSADFSRYAGATIITPNSRETELATGIDPHEDELAVRAGQRILDTASLDSVLMTRAERGMTLVGRGRDPVHIAASAREVFDVVGAGDTVVATLALALGAGLPAQDAATLANAAAGIVVGKRDTATVTRSELIAGLNRISGTGLVNPLTKTLSWREAAAQVAEWQRDGLKVGFTNGCFDLLHVGHVSTFSFAKAHCDRLVVGLNGDGSVRRLKGPTRPVVVEGDRAEMLGALSLIDAVVIFEEDTPAELIGQLGPDLLVKGADYAVGEIAGADTVLARGGQVLTCEIVPGRSTTKMLERS